jgi:hypothetical protein
MNCLNPFQLRVSEEIDCGGNSFRHYFLKEIHYLA